MALRYLKIRHFNYISLKNVADSVLYRLRNQAGGFMVEWYGRERGLTPEEGADFDIRQVPFHIKFKKLDGKKQEETLEMISRYNKEKSEGINLDPLKYRKNIYEIAGIEKS